MPESVTDRPTKSHEYVFLLSKSSRYFFDQEAVREVNSVNPDWNYGSEDYRREITTHNDLSTDGDFRRPKSSGRGWSGVAPAGPNGCGRNLRSVWTIATSPFNDWTSTVRRVPVALDDADGDTKRIPTPDCPEHGSPRSAGPTPGDGERETGDRLHHSRGNGHDPDLARQLSLVAIPPIPDADSVPGSSDSLVPAYSSTASVHSTGTSRKARAPATTLPCTSSAQSGVGIGDTSDSRGLGAQSGHTPESRTGQDDSLAHPSEETSESTARRSSCTCSYYRENTESISHFATFPTELARRCILAGSAKGDTVLDPFFGAGTVGLVAESLGRKWIGIELSSVYAEMARRRINSLAPLFVSCELSGEPQPDQQGSPLLLGDLEPEPQGEMFPGEYSAVYLTDTRTDPEGLPPEFPGEGEEERGPALACPQGTA
jgi:hypothetical protein